MPFSGGDVNLLVDKKGGRSLSRRQNKKIDNSLIIVSFCVDERSDGGGGR